MGLEEQWRNRPEPSLRPIGEFKASLPDIDLLDSKLAAARAEIKPFTPTAIITALDTGELIAKILREIAGRLP